MSATTTRDDKADAALALLCERWPKCFFMFPGRRLPLNRYSQGYSRRVDRAKILRLAFRFYVNNPGHLNAMRLGAARVDLNGEPAGKVDVKNAQARLNGIRKFKKVRKQRRHEEAPKVATPPPAPSPAPSPARRDSRRDSPSGLRDAARKRRGAA